MGMSGKSWQKPTDPRRGFLAALTMLQSANCLHAAPAERWLPACASLSPDSRLGVGKVGSPARPHAAVGGEHGAGEQSNPCVGAPRASAPSPSPAARPVLAEPR